MALVPSRAAYSELSGLISMARRRSPKGEYRVTLRDVIFHLKRCLLIWLPRSDDEAHRAYGLQLKRLCKDRLWLGVSHLLGNNEVQRYLELQQLASDSAFPWWPAAMCVCTAPVASPCTMYSPPCITTPASTNWAGGAWATASSTCAHWTNLQRLYPPALLEETLHIAELCNFSLDELRYEYPEEVVPRATAPTATCANW